MRLGPAAGWALLAVTRLLVAQELHTPEPHVWDGVEPLVPPALPGEPAPPFLAHNATATTLALGWSTAADTGAPIVAYALHGAEIGAPLKPIYDPLLAGRPADADARSFVVRGLRPSTRYAFRVRAATDGGAAAEVALRALRAGLPPLLRARGRALLRG